MQYTQDLAVVLAAVKAVALAGAATLGALSAACTVASRLPFVPARMQRFLARIGVATARFSVEHKDVSP